MTQPPAESSCSNVQAFNFQGRHPLTNAVNYVTGNSREASSKPPCQWAKGSCFSSFYLGKILNSLAKCVVQFRFCSGRLFTGLRRERCSRQSLGMYNVHKVIPKDEESKNQGTKSNPYPSHWSSFLTKSWSLLLPCSIHSINISLISSFSFTRKSRFTAGLNNIVHFVVSNTTWLSNSVPLAHPWICFVGCSGLMKLWLVSFEWFSSLVHIIICIVIHRDLNLGNLLLDLNVNVKVGDFGLAAH